MGQTAARRAAGVVVEMVKEGWLGLMFFQAGILGTCLVLTLIEEKKS